MFPRSAVLACVLLVIAANDRGFAAEYPAFPSMLFENKGQAVPEVRFVLANQGLRVYFEPGEIVFYPGGAPVRLGFGAKPYGATRGAVEPAPLDAAPGRVNFLKGSDSSRWQTDVPLYSGVVYRGIYAGIDMRWQLRDGVVKSEFVLAPGSDVQSIQLRYSGAASIQVEAAGSLLIRTSEGELREKAPEAYTIRDGIRAPVSASFRIGGDGQVGFEVGDYDHGAVLVIDPVLAFSTFLGGSAHDSATSVAVDSAGNAYVGGWAESFDFPVTGGLSRGSSIDGFVAKFTAANKLAYCTYIGGWSTDRVTGIAVDGSGNAVVAGVTSSFDMPVLRPLQSRLRGSTNAFVAKLNAGGNALLFGTFLGGSVADSAAGVALDRAGNIFVAGNATSPDFPIVNAFQSLKSGQQDGFLSKIDPTGAILLNSSYLGGSNLDTIAGLAVDASGSAYVVGNTYSADFPTAAAYRTGIPGAESSFITKFSSTGRTLAYSTFFGGSGGGVLTPEAAMAIAVDANGAAYVTGVTSSVDFPVLNPYQTLSDAGTHGFITEFTPAGNMMVFSTYFGGSGRDWPMGIAVDAPGSIYVSGYTSSTDFPLLNPIQSTNAGIYDSFVSHLNVSGSSLAFSTYLGGASIDSADAIAVDGLGDIVIAGHTMSSNFPLASPFQAANKGNYSAFVAKIASAAVCTYAIAPTTVSQPAAAGQFTLTVTTGVGCSWSAAAGSPWLHPGAPSGTGSGSVIILVDQNSSTAGRNGSVMVATTTVNVSQSGTTCTAQCSVPGDFNVNGVPDLVWQNDTSRQVAVWYMGGSQGSQFQSFGWLDSTGQVGWSVVTVADLNRDGVPDLILENDTTGQAVVWYMGGLGGATVQSTASLQSTAGWKLVGAADVNGDGIPDLVWQNTATAQVSVSLMGGAGGNQLVSQVMMPGAPSGWNAVGMVDFNGDGHPDLVWQNETSRQAVVWYMGGAQGNQMVNWGWLQQATNTPTWKIVGLADVDGNGHPDLIWQEDNTRAVVVWYMSGALGTQSTSAAYMAGQTTGWRALMAH